MGRELKASYREAHIFEADPFTDLLMRERTACGEDNFELGNDCRILQVGSRSDKYWHFMAERNVEIVGAATRRYLPAFISWSACIGSSVTVRVRTCLMSASMSTFGLSRTWFRPVC